MSASAGSHVGIGTLRFIVQSTKLPARELLARIEAFLGSFSAVLRAMPADKFRANAQSVASELAQANKSLESEAVSAVMAIRVAAAALTGRALALAIAAFPLFRVPLPNVLG